MRCPQCHTENKAGRRFCAACGQALALACPVCGVVNEPDDRFCGGCGQALTAIPPSEPTYPSGTARPEEQTAPPATSMPVPPHPAEAERRHFGRTPLLSRDINQRDGIWQKIRSTRTDHRGKRPHSRCGHHLAI
jgi:predicted amidophosphoribosyltransferase